MCYEGLEFDSLITLEVALFRALKVEKNVVLFLEGV